MPPRYGHGETSQRRRSFTSTNHSKISAPKNSAVYFDSNPQPTAIPTATHQMPRPVSQTLARK